MNAFVKPRWQPLLGWATLFLVGLSSAYVLYQRPVFFASAPAAPLTMASGPDDVRQAIQDLEAIMASSWHQGGGEMAVASTDIIAPAPEAAVVAAGVAALEMDPSLKGAVVVSTRNRLYLVLGNKRFRIGQRIGTGEAIQKLSLRSVELASPEGRTRTVDIGRGIGLPAEPFNW